MKTKTKILIALALTVLSSVPFVARSMDPIMLETYRAEAVAMDQANECRRAIGTYSKFRCALWVRNVKNGGVK